MPPHEPSVLGHSPLRLFFHSLTCSHISFLFLGVPGSRHQPRNNIFDENTQKMAIYPMKSSNFDIKSRFYHVCSYVPRCSWVIKFYFMKIIFGSAFPSQLFRKYMKNKNGIFTTQEQGTPRNIGTPSKSNQISYPLASTFAIKLNSGTKNKTKSGHVSNSRISINTKSPHLNKNPN